MLSNVEIEKALREGKIELKVSFIKTKDGIVENELDFLKSPFIKKNLYSDRIKLTMGPAVKVLNGRKVSRKNRFNKFKECFDLRTNNNSYILQPKESIIVLTNENIKLDGKHACIVIPRISLSDVGIIATTAYVDPYYYGIMRINVTNNSNKSFELHFLEEIAQCFFFELPSQAASMYKETFSQKSVFYGNAWEYILNDKRNPFPTKNEDNGDDGVNLLKARLQDFWLFFRDKFLSITLIGILIAGIWAVRDYKVKFERHEELLEKTEEMLTPTSMDIAVNAGNLIGEKEIIVPYDKGEIIGIVCNDYRVKYVITSEGEKKTKIVFSIELSEKVDTNYLVTFTYSVLRKIR